MRGKINPFTSSEFALLGFLYETPTHGYDLHRHITDPEGIGMIWGVKLSNLYAQINKLEKKKYICGVVQPDESRPARTEYHITDDGKAAFDQWLFTVVEHPRDFRQEFMLRLYFMLKFKPDSVIDFCRKQHGECSQWLENTVAASQKIEKNNPFKKSVVEFRITQIQAIVTWLEDLEKSYPSALPWPHF